MIDAIRVAPGSPPRLTERDPRADLGLGSRDAGSRSAAISASACPRFLGRLFAEGERSVLLVLQGLDARQNRHFVIFEADSIAAAWRTRWDSLVLFTSRRYSALPGVLFPGDPEGYARRDEVIAYPEHYADSFELPIEVESPVRSVQRAGHSWLVEVEGRTVQADNIVIATGPFQLANVPAIANDLSPDIVQLHSTQYRRPSDLPSSAPVLVVGGGNTGYQIAKELAATHPVPLAVGSRQMPLPQRPLGRDLFWWLTKTRLIGKSIETRIGRRASQRDSLIGSSPRQVRRHGVGLKPRAIEAHEPPSASRMARDSTSMQ